jgi:hypothetical protein
MITAPVTIASVSSVVTIWDIRETLVAIIGNILFGLLMLI